MSTLERDFVSPALPPLHSHRLAVFIDIENFAGYCADMDVPVDIAPVLDHLSKNHGRIQIKRSFGDVSSLPAPVFNPYRIRRMLQAHQVDHIDIPHRPSSYSKNSADIRLVVEAVALIHQRPEITHIVVVSNDRDFIPLFNHAREHGKLVIGCGPGRSNVNEDYRRACDVFLFHEDWVSAASTSHANLPTVLPAPTALATSAAISPAADKPASAPTAWVAPEQPVVPTDISLAPSTPAPALPGVAPGYFSNRVALEPSERQRSSPERVTAASAPNNDPTEYLLAALRSLQAEGATMVASRVATRLKVLFPGWDVKQVFGSFKQFCIEQAQSGRIVLHNLAQPNFTIAIQEGPAVERPVMAMAPPVPLLAKYQEWSYQKLKISFPAPAVRAHFYEILVQVLDENLDHADFISLQELSRLCSIPLGAITANADDVAFRLCYGLFRGKAFRFYKTESSFNPDITGLAVDPSELDGCFVNNTRASFIHDSSRHGLPLDEEVLNSLMQGHASMLAASASEQPEHEPHSEIAPDTQTDQQAGTPDPDSSLGDLTPSAPLESEPLQTIEMTDQSTVFEQDVPMLSELEPLSVAPPISEPEIKPVSPLPISDQPKTKPKPQKEPPKSHTVAGQTHLITELTEQLSFAPAPQPEAEPQTAPKPKRSTSRKKADPPALRDDGAVD